MTSIQTLTAAQASKLLADDNAEFLPFQFINEIGRTEISAFVAKNHKSGEPTSIALDAWVKDAERQLNEGNSASIEIPSFESVGGATLTINVSNEGLSWGVQIA